MQIGRLAQHIELLLTEHTCVIVPSLGAFVLQAYPAKLQGDTLLPPHTEVSFNPQLTHDDGTLVNAYMRSQHIKNYTEAYRVLLADVAVLRDTFTQQTAVPMGRLGSFAMIEQRLVFTPSTGAFLPDNFGMPRLAYQLRAPRTIAAPTATPAGSITFTIQRTTLYRVAACLIGICLLAITPQSHQNDYTQYANLAPVNFAAIIAEREAALAAEAAAQAEAKALERGHFHIIVGTLKKQSAENFCQRLHDKGYTDACLLPFKRNQYRIAIASYHTKKEALREMRAVRAETTYKRAWVYCEPTNR